MKKRPAPTNGKPSALGNGIITQQRDGDRHLRPAAYYSLSLLAGAIGLSASYVTVQLFALAIRVTEADAVPVAVDALVTAVPDVPRAGTDAPDEDGARFLRVKEGIEAGRIKPSLRAIYAAEGASQEVARRYLNAFEQDGVIERAGRGYVLRAITSPAQKGGEA